MSRTGIDTMRHQQGISLIIVMIILLLGSILVLGSTRLGWLNEKMVGSHSDYQRAFAAAEALVRDAERDIKGMLPDGVTPCNAGASYVGCRNFGAGDPFFPEDDDDFDLIQARVAGGFSNCLRGICLPPSVDVLTRDTWSNPASFASMTAGSGATAVAARYGEFSGASPAAAGNALLAAQAWYWVEVFRYSEAAALLAAASNLPIPDRKHPYVYRITAYVQGLKPGTRVWLRSVFVPYPQNQTS